MTRALPALLLAASLAAGGSPAAARADPIPLHHDLRADGAVTGGAWLLFVGLELAKDRLAPSTCRVCGTNALDAGTRDALLWSDVVPARRASDVLAYGALPAAMAAHQLLAARSAGDTREGLVDVLLVAQATGLAMSLDQVVKLAVGRQRPFVRYRNFPEPDRAPDPDDNLSFYSGHTTFTFALAAAAGTISDLRGYDSAPWVWGAGLGLAAATGYFRIAGDKHYLTDVLVGAAAGLAVGIAVPRVFHGRRDEPGAEPPAGRITAVPLGFVFVF